MRGTARQPRNSHHRIRNDVTRALLPVTLDLPGLSNRTTDLPASLGGTWSSMLRQCGAMTEILRKCSRFSLWRPLASPVPARRMSSANSDRHRKSPWRSKQLQTADLDSFKPSLHFTSAALSPGASESSNHSSVRATSRARCSGPQAATPGHSNDARPLRLKSLTQTGGLCEIFNLPLVAYNISAMARLLKVSQQLLRHGRGICSKLSSGSLETFDDAWVAHSSRPATPVVHSPFHPLRQ